MNPEERYFISIRSIWLVPSEHSVQAVHRIIFCVLFIYIRPFRQLCKRRITTKQTKKCPRFTRPFFFCPTWTRTRSPHSLLCSRVTLILSTNAKSDARMKLIVLYKVTGTIFYFLQFNAWFACASLWCEVYLTSRCVREIIIVFHFLFIFRFARQSPSSSVCESVLHFLRWLYNVIKLSSAYATEWRVETRWTQLKSIKIFDVTRVYVLYRFLCDTGALYIDSVRSSSREYRQ